jgi:uncharacterized protein YjiS (DUF1127 family)
MSKPLTQGSIRTLAHFPGGYARFQQASSPTSMVSWMDTVRAWSARSNERRALRELTEQLDDRLLKDIGISREQALCEAAKPFWQR